MASEVTVFMNTKGAVAAPLNPILVRPIMMGVAGATAVGQQADPTTVQVILMGEAAAVAAGEQFTWSGTYSVLMDLLTAASAAGSFNLVPTLVTYSAGVIELTDIDGDWFWYDRMPYHRASGLRIQSIQFIPGAGDDICILRDGGLTGPIMYHFKPKLLTDNVPHYFGGAKLQPVLDYSECTLTAGSKIIIVLFG